MSTLTEFLKGIADALRTKKGTGEPIPAPNFAQEILGIQTGTDTSDATATAADILSGKTAYGASGKLTGTIPSVSGKTVTPGTAVQTAIGAGNYAGGDITVSGDANLIPENIKEGVSIFRVPGAFKGGKWNKLTVTYKSDSELTFSKGKLHSHAILYVLPTYFSRPGVYTLFASTIQLSSGYTVVNELLINTVDEAVIFKPASTKINFEDGVISGGSFHKDLNYQLLTYEVDEIG